MKKKTQPTVLNYLLPLIMIALGLRHYFKHGLDLVAIIPVVLGLFALYMVLFNHFLLQRIEAFIIKIWKPIGQFITIILLTITFYVVFAPAGLILRLFKKDILDKKFKTDHLSYWLDRSKKEQNDYTQQF